MFIETLDHLLHRLRHGIGTDEVIVLEESLEDWSGDQVLREHADRIMGVDRVVEVRSESRDEVLEVVGYIETRVLDQATNASLMASSDCRDVGGPVFPIVGGVPTFFTSWA